MTEPNQLDPQPELSIDESVRLMLGSVPPPVRAFLTSSERTRVLKTLSQKYRLRIDQAGVFERDLLMMLLGALSPSDFVASLKQIGVEQVAIDGLAKDLNDLVFIRLQEAQRPNKGQATTPRPQAASVPSYKPPAPPQAAPRPLQQTPPTAPRQAQPTPRPPMPQPAPRQSAPPTNLPGVLPGSGLLSDHEVDHINVGEGGARAPQTTWAPKPVPQPPSVSRPAPPAPQMRQTPPPPPRPVFTAPPPVREVPPPPPTPKPAPPPPPKPTPTQTAEDQYRVDPYREAIDLSE